MKPNEKYKNRTVKNDINLIQEKMTTGEIITKLIKAENYFEERIKISDEFIDFVKVMMSRDYEYFKEKE